MVQSVGVLTRRSRNKARRWATIASITLGLGMLLAGFWPTTVVQESQDFLLPLNEPVPATITFHSSQRVVRGAWVPFGVEVSLEQPAEQSAEILPVMVYRLELANGETIPDGSFQMPIGTSVYQKAEWKVRFQENGEFSGTWWVYLEEVGVGDGSIERQALFAKKFTVKSTSILGLSRKTAGWIGFLLILGGLIVEIAGIYFEKNRKTSKLKSSRT